VDSHVARAMKRYNRQEMSLFESFNFLNRDRSWDDRVLENQSLRSVFLGLLVSLFVLGAGTALAMYQLFHHHRFDYFSDAPILMIPMLGFYSFRCARIIYRRLGH
jgi:hypothetical protein